MAKKYILKPGKHQFAPKSHALHENDNLSDEDASWYIERFPYIKVLFIEKPQAAETREIKMPYADPSEYNAAAVGLSQTH